MPGAGAIMPGKARRIDIDDGKSSCIYDLRAQFADGNIQTTLDADICKVIAGGDGWTVSNQD